MNPYKYKWYYHTLIHPIYYHGRRVVRLLKWIPVIWKTDDWDYAFLLDIMKFQLKNMIKYIGEKDRHLSTQRITKNMQFVVDAIERYQQNDYYKQDWDVHRQQYGESEMMTKELESGNHELVGYQYSKCITDEENEIAEQKMMELFYKVEEKRQKDFHRIWRVLDKYLQRFWD